MISIAKFQDKVQQHYPNEHLKVLSYLGARDKCVIECLNCGRIYTFKQSGNILSKKKKILCHYCQDKKEQYKKFKQRIKQNFPFDDLEIINFTHRSEPCDIKCLKCGTVYHFKRAAYVFSKTRQYFCKECFTMKQEIMTETINKFQSFLRNSDIWELKQSLDNIHSHDLVSCKCLYCGKINKKTVYDYMCGRGCLCQSGTEKKNTEIFKKELDDDYELLSDYKDAFSKVKMRHKTCGFIYEVTPHNYLAGKRCPKCSRKESKGEKKIKAILDKYFIKYYQEYPVMINNHKLRFDFFLPDHNIYIEYQGEQHYNPVKYFGGQDRFKIQQKYDNYKQEYAKDNLIIISYQDIDIFAILNKALKLNDHSERK